MSEAAADEREVLASPAGEPAQFPLFSRWLHWVMAGLVVVMLFIGAGMMASLGDYRFLVSVHKPLGMGVLALAVIRLMYRLTHRAPPLPRSMNRTERRAATASECLLYGLMVAQPLVGWAMVSASDTPFELGGVHLPAIVPPDPQLYSALRETHAVFGYALFLLFTMHMLAVLVHALMLRDGLLTRMALWRRSRLRPAAPSRISDRGRRQEGSNAV
ncbi:cytochrome b [Streptomyces marokkonensis]|uniref:Cytochrome b n=1 Tax=Streptomyces marokkonensis TaxID=324855 RepID=A0ABW6QFN2_9ACTN